MSDAVENGGNHEERLDDDEYRQPHEFERPPDVPDWEDEYLDRVSDRLMFNYDLGKDRRVHGETFPLFGEMRLESQKHLFHPALNYANHASEEFLFARRTNRVTVADLERLVDLAHDLADEWIERSEEHFGTEFTFVLVAPEIPPDVRDFVAGFEDRTLLKYGYYGHYEVNLAVVAPDHEEVVTSPNADVGLAFALWEDLEPPEPSGLLARLVRRLRG